jgi:hypothetical protein
LENKKGVNQAEEQAGLSWLRTLEFWIAIVCAGPDEQLCDCCVRNGELGVAGRCGSQLSITVTNA